MKTSKLSDHLLIALFVIPAVLQGYKLGIGDLATYIPFVLHEHNPALFANDLLIDTLDAHPVYIWKFAAVFLNWMELPTLFKLLFFLQIVIIAYAVKFFYQQFFGKDKGWIIVLLTLVISSSSAAMGKYGLNPYGYFHPGALAFGLALIAFTLLDRGQWAMGSILTGLLFLLHPFTAIYAALFWFFKLLIKSKRVPQKTILLGVILFLIASSPSWISYLQNLFAAYPAEFNKALWFKIVESRMRFSYFMSQWVPDRFIQLGLALIALIYFRKHSSFRNTLPIVISTLVALITMGFAELFSIKLLLQLQLARCSYFLFVLLTFYIADYIIIIERIEIKLANIIWLFVGYVFMIHTPVEQTHNPVRWWLVGTAFATLIFIFWPRPVKWRRIYIGMGMVLLVLATGASVYKSYTNTGRFYDQTLTTPWEDLQVWCRGQVPVNDIIMTPIYLDGFRSFSRRSIYGTYKDGAPHNYSPHTIFRWWERMEKLGVSIPFHKHQLHKTYHENAISVAASEGIRFVVYDKRVVTFDGQALYENQRFGILDLELSLDARFSFL